MPEAQVWLYFAAGSAYVKLTHSLIFTENTNKVWFKNYGLEFKTPDKPSEVYCTVGEHDEEIRKTTNTGDRQHVQRTG